MKKKLLIALPLASVMMFSGCATILGGGNKQTISISSDSAKRMKAVVSYTDGSTPQYLTLPGTVSVSRKNENIIVKSQNNEFDTVVINKNVNGWFWANILGLDAFPLSSTTDAVSGAMWTYDDAITVHEN